MSDVDFANQMYELLRTMEQINRLAMTLPGPIPGVFAPVSLDMPRFSPAELGCMRVVSWLFVQHFDAGRIGAAFLESRAEPYGHDPDGDAERHRLLIQHLRTLFQHNLDAQKPHDRDIQGTCGRWFRSQCGTAIPWEEQHWNACLAALLAEARQCFGILLKTVRSIEADESREVICREWAFRLARFYPPHVFDELIGKVAIDMGRDGIDALALRKRFYDSWTKQPGLLRDDVNFEAEARKLIEHAILTMVPKVLPITGKDLMEEFGLGPGPLIGSLLQAARTICESAPCSRNELLERLRAEVIPSDAPTGDRARITPAERPST